jgi:catechol 2,3-dioxygenase-like lactoylglutathione lyase family enzyme
VELLEHFNGSPRRTPPPFDPVRGVGTDRIIQVGIIVHDIERSAARYVDLLGLPTPPIIQTTGYSTMKTMYRGQPSEALAKLAFFSLGQVQIELIQPDAQRSVWRDFLDQHGEGAHHIAFPVRDTQRVTDYLATHGITVTQQGLYTDGSGMYTYLDTQALLGTTVELLESFPR